MENVKEGWKKGRLKERKGTETMSGKARIRSTKGRAGRDFYSLRAANENMKLVIKYRTARRHVSEDRSFTVRTSKLASVCCF
jgi:hypothetical protein